MFRHNASTPLIFYFDEFDDEVTLRVREWLLRRGYPHVARRLVNEERVRKKATYELIFADAAAAMEFKLTFL